MKKLSLSLLWLVVSSGVMTGQIAPTQSTPPASTSTGAADDQAVKLNPFEVSASNNIGYGVSSLQSSSKLVQSYIDVPQTVNVLTSEFMNDEMAFDTAHMLEYLPNVQGSSYGVVGLFEVRGVGLYSTGQLEAIYIDGAQVAGGNWGYFLPTEFYDRIELVKGPSSAAFGIGEPSGMINYISKVPQGIERTDISTSIGDYGNWKFTLDSQGFARADKTLTYRMDLDIAQGNYAQQLYRHTEQGGQISLKWQPNSENSATLIMYGVKNTEPAYWPSSAVSNETVAESGGLLQGPGTPAPAHALPSLVNPDETVAAKGNNTNEATDFRAELILNHTFNEHFHIQNITSVDDLYEVFLQQLPSIGWQNATVGFAALDLALNYHFPDNRASDAIDLVSDFDTKFGHFKTLLDGNVYSNDYESNRDIGFPQDSNNPTSYRYVSVYSPDQSPIFYPSYPLGTGPNGAAGGWIYNNVQESYNEKGFGMALTEIASWWNDRVIVEGGVRKDFFHEVSRFYESNTVHDTGREHTPLVPRVAVTVKPLPNIAVYGLVTEHKDPTQTLAQPAPAQYDTAITNTLAANGYHYGGLVAYTPDETQEEFGIKGNLFGNTITFSACVFHIDFNGAQSQRSVQFYDSSPLATGAFSGETPAPGTTLGQPGNYITTFPVIVGENLHGYEASVVGVVTRRLTFEADYASTRGNYPNPDSTTNGKSSVAPPITLSFHGKYDFGNYHGNGFYVTAGGTYYFGGWMYNEAYNNYQGLGYNSSQYVINAGVGYRWDHGRQSIYANVDNVFNRAVIASNADTSSEYLPLEQAFVTYRISF